MLFAFGYGLDWLGIRGQLLLMGHLTRKPFIPHYTFFFIFLFVFLLQKTNDEDGNRNTVRFVGVILYDIVYFEQNSRDFALTFLKSLRINGDSILYL